MEPVKIDWKTIDSVFVKEDLYENINAPKWVDFSAPEESVDDEAWFCRPDCKHPKTVEDFLRLTPTSSSSSSSKRLGSSGKASEVLPLGDRNKREANLKRRGLLAQPQPLVSPKNVSKLNEDGENQNPNFSTPPNQQAKTLKAMIKSSAEKTDPVDDMNCTNLAQNDKAPKLRSTLSARNLFAGKDILNQITEFCNELKKMATKAKERENGNDELKNLDGRDKERNPLLEVGKEKAESFATSNAKEKMRTNKRAVNSENIPPHLDLKNIRRKEEESVMQIRTNPPSPQCFSAIRGSAKPAPTKGSKSRLMEKEIHQEVEQSKDKDSIKEELLSKHNNEKTIAANAEKETRTLDMFWFLKPCALSR